MRRIALLGSTGSIGTSALAVVERHRERFHVEALAAHRSASALLEQVERYGPSLAVLVDGDAFAALPARRGETRWSTGREALLEAASHPDVDVVLNAVVGAAGLEATVAALAAGKRLALANKESLVAGGPLVMDALRRGGGELIPVDSEHSAILQCVAGRGELPIRRLILTASGGPFRTWQPERLAEATPGDALRHPTWDMGAKITVDSATLVNKALEVIEAHWLFGVPYEQIEVVVHPQSIIHSMVEFADGSILAQMGFPTMELPILYALTHPERVDDDGTRFDPVAAGHLTFEPVDHGRFPAFGLGIAAGERGGTMPAVFNAANEVAVAAFLAGRLPFPGIPRLIEAIMAGHTPVEATSLGAIFDADKDARARARAWLETLC
ncbi:MAG TPA: 1-deoxy-D-xylulose-5-phosphate reductoisomerase [Longimicrobiales bacterium]|nr:1-deoxy-D-xylulose-5-phosphate reductoisomerase [Longimicrobiales bacterium]